MSALLASPYWPFIVLILAILMVFVLISRLKLHPFVALMLSAIFVGLISNGDGAIGEQANSLITAVELPMQEFGIMAGKIAFVIVLAALIGTAMMESGAADKIVSQLVKGMGEKYAALALLISGLILSIPVFFDTVFFLLIPLALALTRRLKKNYLLFIMAISGGAVITHSLAPPTPGPLTMAETMNIDLGFTILAGLMAALIPAVVVLLFGKWINQRMPVSIPTDTASDTQAAEGQPSEPSLMTSLMPLLIPVGLIAVASVVALLEAENTVWGKWMGFFGNKNIAMLLGTIWALVLWVRQKKLSLETLTPALGPSMEIAGIIILITCAGGAFGAMIKHSGIGDAIKLAMEGFRIHYILLAWMIAAIMKIAQGLWYGIYDYGFLHYGRHTRNQW